MIYQLCAQIDPDINALYNGNFMQCPCLLWPNLGLNFIIDYYTQHDIIYTSLVLAVVS